MTTVLAVHSHRGGTGKSSVAANIATMMARDGLSVVLVDTDIQSPGLNVLLGLPSRDMRWALSDYLVGKCDMMDTLHDLTDRIQPGCDGSLTLIPSQPDPAVITRLVGQGYDAGLLDEGLRTVLRATRPDVLLLDTHSGLTNETLVALAHTDSMAVVMRPDSQEYQGAIVSTTVTRRLNCPATVLVLNMVDEDGDLEEMKASSSRAYGRAVTAVLPYTREVARHPSAGLFSHQNPGHGVVPVFRSVMEHLLVPR
jgi:septum site-determining protein MinD